MNENKFKIGDVVRLKSGGPRMTVRLSNYIGLEQVLCDWFYKGENKSAIFNIQMLEIAKENKKHHDEYYY